MLLVADKILFSNGKFCKVHFVSFYQVLTPLFNQLCISKPFKPQGFVQGDLQKATKLK